MLQDIKVAALFLTRFPVQVDGKVSMRDLAAAVYAVPLMGAAVGLLGGLGFTVAGWLGLPSLAAEAGQPEPLRVMLATFIAIGAVVLLLPLPVAVPALIATGMVSLLWAAWLGRRFGGCTGDTLGAVQQVAEITFLFAVVARQ